MRNHPSSIILRPCLRLMGPLSDKELRVASRRRCHYALRAGYIVLLSAIMLSAWYVAVTVQRTGTTAFGVSQASTASLFVTLRTIWFQFAAAQLVAAVTLSSSVSDELRRGTLSVLLTTPITSVHLVAGKLLAGLLQVILLLAISVPALAILRVQGGVSWDLVVSGSGITLTAALFAGALSLWLSTYCRHPYQAVTAGAVVYLVLFGGLPLAVTGLAGAGVLGPTMTASILNLASPFRALSAALPSMPWGRPGAVGGAFAWPIHCLIMAALAVALLGVAAQRIRRAAAGELRARTGRSRPIERLRGSPVAWKENPRGFFPWRRSDIGVVVATVAFCALILLVETARMAGSASFYQTYMVYAHYLLGGLWLVVLLRLALAAAGGITREKESGAWPVLLTTPLNNRGIIWGKARAALRRNAVLLLAFLVVHTWAVAAAGPGPKVLVASLYILSRLASILFVLTAGLYFGVRLRTTTAAATATIAAYLCLNYLIAGGYNPLLAQLFRRIAAGAGRWGNNVIVVYLAVWMGGAFLLDTLLGAFLLQRAIRNVRRYVF